LSHQKTNDHSHSCLDILEGDVFGWLPSFYFVFWPHPCTLFKQIDDSFVCFINSDIQMVRADTFSQLFCTVVGLLGRIFGAQIASHKDFIDDFFVASWFEIWLLHYSFYLVESVLAALFGFLHHLGEYQTTHRCDQGSRGG